MKPPVVQGLIMDCAAKGKACQAGGLERPGAGLGLDGGTLTSRRPCA